MATDVLMCRVTVFFVAIVTASAGTACGGAGAAQRDDRFEYRTDEAYLRLPSHLLGAQIEAQTAPELLQCYESEASNGPQSLTAVQLELVFQGGQLRPRLSQQQSNLSDRFTSCVEQVTIQWNLQPDVATEGEIVPIEFGPAQ